MLASFRTQQKTLTLVVEETKLAKELGKAKTGKKVIEKQEGLERSKTLDSG